MNQYFWIAGLFLLPVIFCEFAGADEPSSNDKFFYDTKAKAEQCYKLPAGNNQTIPNYDQVRKALAADFWGLDNLTVISKSAEDNRLDLTLTSAETDQEVPWSIDIATYETTAAAFEALIYRFTGWDAFDPAKEIELSESIYRLYFDDETADPYSLEILVQNGMVLYITAPARNPSAKELGASFLHALQNQTNWRKQDDPEFVHIRKLYQQAMDDMERESQEEADRAARAQQEQYIAELKQFPGVPETFASQYQTAVAELVKRYFANPSATRVKNPLA